MRFGENLRSESETDLILKNHNKLDPLVRNLSQVSQRFSIFLLIR